MKVLYLFWRVLIMISVEFEKVKVTWRSGKSSQSSLVLHNTTIKDAYEKAVFFGFKPSPWWNFIARNKVTITASNSQHRPYYAEVVYYSEGCYKLLWPWGY